MNEAHSTKTTPESPVKQPYTAPKLVVYGDLRMITQTRRRAGSDGGVAPNNNST